MLHTHTVPNDMVEASYSIITDSLEAAQFSDAEQVTGLIAALAEHFSPAPMAHEELAYFSQYLCEHLNLYFADTGVRH